MLAKQSTNSEEQVPVDGKSRLRDWTEPEVFVSEVAISKQHDVFAGAIVFGVLLSARASF